jgi:hypothetical protein
VYTTIQSQVIACQEAVLDLCNATKTTKHTRSEMSTPLAHRPSIAHTCYRTLMVKQYVVSVVPGHLRRAEKAEGEGPSPLEIAMPAREDGHVSIAVQSLSRLYATARIVRLQGWCGLDSSTTSSAQQLQSYTTVGKTARVVSWRFTTPFLMPIFSIAHQSTHASRVLSEGV